MSKFNVTVVAPDGFLHWRAFSEVIDSLSWSLAALGHDVSVTSNWFSESGETNIIFGAELIADFQRLPRNSIVFNLEQPSHPHLTKVRRLVRESGCAVWDYSARSVDQWRADGFPVAHLPIGWTPNLERSFFSEDGNPPFTYDACFFGWLTPRRVGILDALRRAGLNVYASAACYGGARDSIVSRSRVCLNLHHDGRDRFEIVRCSYLMSNYSLVVTEPSSDDDEYQDLRGLTIVPQRALVDTVAALVRDTNWQLRLDAVRSIRARDMVAATKAALDATDLSALSPAAPVVSVPSPSRPLEFKQERAARRQAYIEEGRALATTVTTHPHDPRVFARYRRACSEGDMRDFAKWMAEHAHGNIVEIGVRDGASTAAFLYGLERTYGHLYSIDIQPCGHLFSGHPQWTFIQADSKDFPSVIAQLPFEFDVLLIDGDHSREGVLSDIEYARNVRPGGCVLFHDIRPEPRPVGCNDMGWPGDAAREVFDDLCRNMAPLGWTSEILPGRYGMGVLYRPQPDPAVTLEPRAEDKRPEGTLRITEVTAE